VVARPGFTEGLLAESFPAMDAAAIRQILDALQAMKVIAPN